MGGSSLYLVLLVVILVSACVSSTPVTLKTTAAGKETINLPQKDTSDSGGYGSEDPYLSECYRDCKITRSITTCLKYRTLRFIHEKTSFVQDEGSSEPEVVLTLGRMNLVALPHASSTTYTLGLSKQRSTDSEIVKMFRFALREIERLARSYTVTFSKKNGDDVKNPRLIGETLFSGAMEARGPVKKIKLALLLPLLYFLHLKALLVHILLAVLFIKKVMILGITFLPSLLALAKLRKQHSHLKWEPEPVIVFHPEIFSVHHRHAPHPPELLRGRGSGKETAPDDVWEGKYSETDVQTFEPYQDHVMDTGQWQHSEYPSMVKDIRPFHGASMAGTTIPRKPGLVSYTSNDGSLEGGIKQHDDSHGVEQHKGQVTNSDQWKYPANAPEQNGVVQSSLVESINLRKKPWLAPYAPNGCFNTWNSVEDEDYSGKQDGNVRQRN